MKRPINFNIILKSSKGSSIVFFAITITLIAAVTALTVDIGAFVLEKAKLSSSVDAAALAGAQELVTNSGNTNNVVTDYLAKNIQGLKSTDIVIDESQKTVQVSGVKSVNGYFAKIIDVYNHDISSTAKAKVENIVSLRGARPLAVVQQTFSYGTLYTLKEGGGDGTTGNYAAIALGGTGGSVYRNNLMQGYGGTISVGDLIETETGNISGTTQTCINQLIQQCNHTPPCTYLSYNVHCSRIIFIPVVNTLSVNGRKYVQILGFATFFLEGVTTHGGQADVIGRFITYCMQGETSSIINDYGTYGIKLVK